MPTDYYPPPSFFFSVSIIGPGISNPPGSDADASFQEVSGIQATTNVEEVEEGGENRFVHRLPKAPKFSNLVLKRGIVTRDSSLTLWASSTIGSPLVKPISPRCLLVTLLGGDASPLVAWGFINAFPIQWQTNPLNSTENRILIESFELSYNYFERIDLGAGAAASGDLDRFARSLA